MLQQLLVAHLFHEQVLGWSRDGDLLKLRERSLPEACEKSETHIY